MNIVFRQKISLNVTTPAALITAMVTVVSPEAAVRLVRAISPNKVGEVLNQCRSRAGYLNKQERKEWPTSTLQTKH